MAGPRSWSDARAVTEAGPIPAPRLAGVWSVPHMRPAPPGPTSVTPSGSAANPHTNAGHKPRRRDPTANHLLASSVGPCTRSTAGVNARGGGAWTDSDDSDMQGGSVDALLDVTVDVRCSTSSRSKSAAPWKIGSSPVWPVMTGKSRQAPHPSDHGSRTSDSSVLAASIRSRRGWKRRRRCRQRS
jgi:hypothetical protein